ncbi:MAG: lysylphosphatidylglycerol synthase transmembrane domain-containing protein [Candidatus Pacebacteria bacterium]|nr:lysylphosphatidylglycerol synthase transmembrane domain-containing protein [Candidatus Paceibacterota bacterium]
MLKKLLKRSYILIGFLIFFWVVKDIDFSYFKGQISNLNLVYLPFASLLYIPILLLNSYRFKKMVSFQNIKYSLKEAFYIVGISTMLAIATPGRIGDFSKIIYLKKDGHSLGKSILSNVLEKIFDLLFVLIFCAILFIFLPSVPRIEINGGMIIRWIVPIAIFAGFLTLYLYKTNDKAKEIIKDIFLGLKQYNFKRSLFIFFLTAIAWISYFFIINLLAASVGISEHLSFFFVSFLGAFSVLAALLPISVMGIGAREAVFIFLLSPFGIAKETIVLFSLLIMANYLTLVLVGLVCWYKKFLA